MRNYKCDMFFLCIVFLSSLSSLTFGHDKPKSPPYDPHNCSCLIKCNKDDSSSSSSDQGSHQGSFSGNMSVSIGSPSQNNPHVPPPSSSQNNQQTSPPSPSQNNQQASPPTPGQNNKQASSPSPNQDNQQASPPIPGQKDQQASPPSPGQNNQRVTPPTPGQNDQQAAPPSPSQNNQQASPPTPGQNNQQVTPPSPGQNDQQASPPPGQNDQLASPPIPDQNDQQAPPPGQNNQQATPPTPDQNDQQASPPTPNQNDKQAAPPSPSQNNQQAAPPPGQNDQQASPPTLSPSQNDQQVFPPSPSQNNQQAHPPSPSQNNQQSSPPSPGQNNQQGPSPNQNDQQVSSPSPSQNDERGSSSNQRGHKGSSFNHQQNSSFSSSGSYQHNSSFSSSTSTNSSSSAAGQRNRSISTGSEGKNDFCKGAFTKVYAFGDSFTDTGNAVSMEGSHSIIGGLFGKSFYGSSAQLSGHRLSNGRLIVDYLCENLGLPDIQAYKETGANFNSGVNFAVAGSTCLSSDFFASHKLPNTFMWKSKPESVLSQVDWFNKFLLSTGCKGKGEAECKSQLQDTLFWVGAIGFSDYTRTSGVDAISGKSLTETSVNKTCKILKAMLDRGAKYIVVQGLPPAGCCPLQLLLNPSKDRDSMGCSSGINTIIRGHNELLQKRIGELKTQYNGCFIVYADTWKAYKKVLVNYKKYDFQEPFKACCGAGGGRLNFDLNSLCGSTGTSACNNPQNFISWDGIHYTEAMNKVLTNMFISDGFCSPSFKEMIQAKKTIKK